MFLVGLMSCRENKYIPPSQRNREPMSWGPGRQNSPRLAQGPGGPSGPRPSPHDYSPSSGADQKVVNGGAFVEAGGDSDILANIDSPRVFKTCASGAPPSPSLVHSSLGSL